MYYYITGMYYISLITIIYVIYTTNTTLYTDISTVVFYYVVLNDGQWSVGFVLDSNGLTNPFGVIKDIERFNNGKRCRKVGIDFDLDTFQPKDKEEEGAQANNETLLHDLLIAQRNIKSLQERLLELECQQGMMDGWIDEYYLWTNESLTR